MRTVNRAWTASAVYTRSASVTVSADGEQVGRPTGGGLSGGCVVRGAVGDSLLSVGAGVGGLLDVGVGRAGTDGVGAVELGVAAPASGGSGGALGSSTTVLAAWRSAGPDEQAVAARHSAREGARAARAGTRRRVRMTAPKRFERRVTFGSAP